MTLRISFIVLILFIISSSIVQAKEVNEIQERLVYGWVENVMVQPQGIKGKGINVKAKLDSGAKTSSMHAEKIERFEKDGDDWVRFMLEFEDPDDEDEMIKHRMERPVERNILIKRHGDKHQRRPVVKLEMCIGPHIHKVKFSLADRDNFIYPVLLGRTFLKEIALIDPAATFLRGPTCGDSNDSEQNKAENEDDEK